MVLKYTNSTNKSFNQTRHDYTTTPIKKDKAFFNSLGDSFLLKNEYRKAIKEYLVSLMIDKNNFKAYKGASIAYKNLKEYDKAIKHLKNARSVYSFDSDVYYELGLNYLLNLDSVNAQKNFIRTIKLNPKDKNAQLKLALTHEFAGEREMAQIIYEKMIEEYPTFIPAYSNLASLHIEKFEYEKALKIFKKILEINNEYYRAFLGIGICFDKLDKPNYAIRYYKKYIAVKPNAPTSKNLISRIVELKSQNYKKQNNKLKII